MRNRYRTVFFICLAGAGALLAAVDVVHGQNFAGTVTAGDLDQQPAVEERAGTDPLSPEPTAAAEDSTVIPEAIASMSHYTVGATDILEITVMRHPEVSGQFVINNEGNIQYEFVGDMKVDGLTKDAVKKLLTLYREKRSGENEGLEAFINRTGAEAIKAALQEFTVLQNYAADPKAFMDWGDGEEFHLKVGKGECAG